MVGVTCVEKNEERGIDSTPASEATVEADPLRAPRNQPTESVGGEALEFGFPGYGPEWRSSLELGRTRAQCPNPTIEVRPDRDHHRGNARPRRLHPQRSGGVSRPVGEHTLVMLMLAYTGMKTHVDATAAMSRRPQENTFSGRPSMFYPVRWVAGNGPFEVRGRWSGGAPRAS